jgi:hypothetical protein
MLTDRGRTAPPVPTALPPARQMWRPRRSGGRSLWSLGSTASPAMLATPALLASRAPTALPVDVPETTASSDRRCEPPRTGRRGSTPLSRTENPAILTDLGRTTSPAPTALCGRHSRATTSRRLSDPGAPITTPSIPGPPAHPRPARPRLPGAPHVRESDPVPFRAPRGCAPEQTRTRLRRNRVCSGTRSRAPPSA